VGTGQGGWRRHEGLSVLPGAFWLAAIATLGSDAFAVVHQGPVFGTRVAAYNDLHEPLGILLLLGALAAAHLFVTFCVYRMARTLLRRRPRELVVVDFLGVALVAALADAAVKLKLGRYFGARMDLDLVRELAGGSLAEAFVYVRQDIVPLLLGLVPAVLGWVIVRRAVAHRGGGEPAPPRRLGLWVWIAALLAAAIPLFAAGQDAVVRRQLERFGAPALLYWVFGTATDPDLDGYSLFSTPPDGHPFDAARHPFALDVPGDGVDQDEFGGDFRYVPPEPAIGAPVFGTTRRNVVLVVLESTRADAIGKRWGGRLVAPNLTALAAEGSAAPEAYSHHGLTARSLKTLFTGAVDPLPDSPSLFSDFKRAGYRVAVFSSQAEDFGAIARTVRMRENSDIYVDAESGARASGEFGTHSKGLIDGRALLGEMDRRLGWSKGWERPTFIYVNLQAPHFPYYQPGMPQFLPGAPVPRDAIEAANRDWVARTYWNAVAYADWSLGQIVARLKATGRWDDTIVVVLGDHGEELFENVFIGHGHALNALQTRIPLVFSKPIALPRPLGQQDLRALVLAAAGAKVAVPPAHPVFQVLGYFERPSLLGLVEAGGKWTRYAPATGEAWSDDGERRRYRDLPPGSPLKAKVERIVDLWMAYRWRQRLHAAAGTDPDR
jgi:hypothetical protein